MSVSTLAQTTRRRRRWRATRNLVTGSVMAGVMVLLAVVGGFIAPHSPTQAVAGQELLAPSWAHPFGTDSAGLDVFSRVLAAPRYDITIALASTLLAMTAGSVIGAVAGYYRNVAAEATVRISDLIQSFPVFILALAAVVVTNHSVIGLVVVIAAVNCPLFVRLARAETLELRERTFVAAAEALGWNRLQVLRRHILPNALGPILAQGSVAMGFALLLTAGLSFVGAGVRVPTPEWGSMIAIGAPNMITGQWWPSVFPGLALYFAVFGFALLGDAVAVWFDPRRR